VQGGQLHRLGHLRPYRTTRPTRWSTS
jgi:hypothetical protein